MPADKLSILWIFFLVAILSRSGNMYAQLPEPIQSIAGVEAIDTSDYIPSFYPGALDYNLMIAASRGYASEIVRLISIGADVNSTTNEGATPLVFAITNNQIAAVRTLLKYDPLINKVTLSYETPLLIAVKEGNFEITETLIRAGADVDATDRYAATSLHHASLYGYLDIVDLLLYYNASIDSKSVDGTTPLLASIWAGNADVADLLIQNGANMEARDYEGFTPFLMASYNGDTLLMDLLYKRGVDIYATKKSGHNALTLSIIGDHRVATEFLLRIGNKWTATGSNTPGPYTVASKYRRKEIINLLEKNNVPGKIKFGIDQAAINASSRLGLHDIYTGINISFKEPYINGGFIVGCDMKLWYSRVLIKESDNLFYQYMDKGYVAYAGLFKDFALTDYPDRFNFSLSTSLLAGYSFGNKLKGTFISPENKYLVIPSISCKLTKMNFSVNLGLEYMKTSYYKNGPVWLRIGCSYTHFFDKVRTKVKTIKWYQ
jgi:ankyrin repeat protein